jgi:hypothetical protein
MRVYKIFSLLNFIIIKKKIEILFKHIYLGNYPIKHLGLKHIKNNTHIYIKNDNHQHMEISKPDAPIFSIQGQTI